MRADHHTYFVGCDEWGFSVWAHNAYGEMVQTARQQGQLDLLRNGVLNASPTKVATGLIGWATRGGDVKTAVGRLKASLENRGFNMHEQSTYDLIDAGLRGHYDPVPLAQAVAELRINAMRSAAGTAVPSAAPTAAAFLSSGLTAHVIDHMLGQVKASGNALGYKATGGHTMIEGTVQPAPGSTPIVTTSHGATSQSVLMQNRGPAIMSSTSGTPTVVVPAGGFVGKTNGVPTGVSSLWPANYTLSRIVAETYHARYFAPTGAGAGTSSGYQTGLSSNGMPISFGVNHTGGVGTMFPTT